MPESLKNPPGNVARNKIGTYTSWLLKVYLLNEGHIKLLFHTNHTTSGFLNVLCTFSKINSIEISGLNSGGHPESCENI